jgi:hypothetical protein
VTRRFKALLIDWYDRLVARMFPLWRRYQLLPFPLPAIQRFEQLRSLRLTIGLMDQRLASRPGEQTDGRHT